MYTPHETTEHTGSRTVDAALQQFYCTLRSRETRRSYRRYLTRFLDENDLRFLPLEELQAIPSGDLRVLCERFLEPLIRRDPAAGAITSSSTRDAARNAISSFFSYLMDDFDFPRNPLRRITNIRAISRSNTDYLTPDQLIAYLRSLKEASGQGEAHMRDFLLVTGMFLEALRREEVRRLRWQDFDFTDQTLRVRVKMGKEKINPVPLGYLHLLFQFRVQYGEDGTYIFRPLRRGAIRQDRPLSANAVYNIVVRSAGRLFPDKNITPHSLRTSYITMGHLWGANLKEIQNGAGLASLEMVGYYDRRSPTEYNFTNAVGDYLVESGII